MDDNVEIGYKAIIKSPDKSMPDGFATRTKYFLSKEEAESWMNEPNRYKPAGSETSITKIKMRKNKAGHYEEVNII